MKAEREHAIRVAEITDRTIKVLADELEEARGALRNIAEGPLKAYPQPFELRNPQQIARDFLAHHPEEGR